MNRNFYLVMCIALAALAIGGARGIAYALQGSDPPTVNDRNCLPILVGAQCSNESQSTSCPPTGGGVCSYCRVPPQGFNYLERCLPEENKQCINLMSTPGTNDVDCGQSMSGSCDGAGNCVNPVPGNNCNDTRRVGCAFPN